MHSVISRLRLRCQGCTFLIETWLTDEQGRQALRNFKILSSRVYTTNSQGICEQYNVWRKLNVVPELGLDWNRLSARARKDIDKEGLTSLVKGEGDDTDLLGFFQCTSSRPSDGDGIHLCLNNITRVAERLKISEISLAQFTLLHEIGHAYLHTAISLPKRHERHLIGPQSGLAQFANEAFAEYVASEGIASGTFWLPDLSQIRGVIPKVLTSTETRRIHQRGCSLPYWFGAAMWARDAHDPAPANLPCRVRLHRLRDLFGTGFAGSTVNMSSLSDEVQHLLNADSNGVMSEVHPRCEPQMYRHSGRHRYAGSLGPGQWPPVFNDPVPTKMNVSPLPCKRYPIILHP